MPEPAVSIRRVSKSYASGAQSVSALEGVDLEVFPGELVLLMGPSGSGKTTLLSIAGCILRPSSGSVVVGGRDVSKLSERELPRVRLSQIGFVFQTFNLFPNLTAGENVEMALELKGVRGREARRQARELIGRVGLADRYSAFPAGLSGGQNQRVAIARALAGNPPLILADEPTAALDFASGRAVLTHLRELANRERRAVLVVTHDPRLLEFASRVVHIEDGRIMEAAA